MSNTYYPDPYDPSHVVLDDMDNINSNFEALRTVFSSSSGPAVPVPFQFWADNSNNIVKVRNDLNSSWLPMFNVEDNEIIIQDTVRKGSIVEGEDIDPASCTLQTCGSGSGAGVSFPCSYIGGSDYSISISGPSGGFIPVPGMSTLVFVYDGMSCRGRIYVNTNFTDLINVRLKVGAETSADSLPFAALGGIWSPEVTLSVVGTSWQELKWEIDWGTKTFGTIKVTGHNVSEMI